MMSSKSKEKDAAFKKGDKVQARWSGSNIYYDAKILDLFTKHCKVQFEDGSVFSVKLSDVKVIKSDRETPPKTTKLRPRSRSRSSGRARKTRSRSRSPARKIEKSASVPKVERRTSARVEKILNRSEENSNSIPKDETDSIIKTGPPVEGRHSTVTSTVVKNSFSMKEIYGDTEESVSDTTRLRTSSRLAALQAAKAARASEFIANTLKQHAALKDDTKYSDDEDEEIEIQATVIKPQTRSFKILSFFVTLLKIVFIPVSLLFLIFSCTRKQCTILEIPQFYARWRDLENSVRLPFLAIAAFHAVQCLLSVIPIGRKQKGFSTNSAVMEYRLNGFLNLILSVLVFLACSYFGIYMNWGFDKFRSIALSSVIYCILWSVAMHIFALIKENGTRISKVPLIGNFYDGSYINPLLFGIVDVKTTFIRAGLTGLVLLNLSILQKYFLMKGFVTVPLALTASMQIFFVLDLFLREEKLLSTAMYSSDSVGYSFIMTTGFIVPMALGLQNVFNYIQEAKAGTIPHWCSAAMVGLFLCGYYIYMTSGNLKHNFRKNPFSPSLSGVNSIPTSKQKRLISSSWWGLIRHPNYLGLLIMTIAWTLPCGFTHLLPFGPLIMLMGALIIRCFRVENECKEKYGPAWQNYTEKVRSRLIPYIF